jgi:hypothetical protein
MYFGVLIIILLIFCVALHFKFDTECNLILTLCFCFVGGFQLVVISFVCFHAVLERPL